MNEARYLDPTITHVDRERAIPTCATSELQMKCDRMQKCIDLYRLASVRCHVATLDSNLSLRQQAEAALRGDE
jgi:hypothetical protein